MSNVLIIEDDVFLSEDLKFFIEAAGHYCKVYNDSESVMKKINELSTYDVIVLDLMMMRGPSQQGDDPTLDSGEIIFNRIKKIYNHDIKIVIISAKNHFHFNDYNNVHVIKKPLTELEINTLLELI